MDELARLTVAFTCDDESLSGHIEMAGRPDQPFSGWIGLLSGLRAGVAQSGWTNTKPGCADLLGPAPAGTPLERETA